MDITTFIISPAYNSLNFFIFIALYFWAIYYQFRLNTTAAYYISSIIDIVFSIYLLLFIRNSLIDKDTLLSFLCVFVVFGFIIIRLICAYIFPQSFLKMGNDRKKLGCKYDEMPKHILDSVFKCKTLYLYSTVLILLLLYMVLFWGDKINDQSEFEITTNIFAFDRKVYITYVIIIANIILSTLHMHYVSKYYKEVNRTTMCPPREDESIWNEFDVNNDMLIDKDEFKQILIKAGIALSGDTGNSNPTVDYIFPRYDRDEDGYLNFEEYKSFYRDYFGITSNGSTNFHNVPNIDREKKIAVRHYQKLWNKYKTKQNVYVDNITSSNIKLITEEDFLKLLRDLQLGYDKDTTRAYIKLYGSRRKLSSDDNTDGEYTLSVSEFGNFFDENVSKLYYNN